MTRIIEMIKEKGVTSVITDTENIVCPQYIVNFRGKVNISAKLLAIIIGVSEETVEAWEDGSLKIDGPSSRLIYLLNENPNLIDKLYKVVRYSQENNKE